MMSKFSCPNCNASTSSVDNTRMSASVTLRRTRKCSGCGHAFHTVELTKDAYQYMLKATSRARDALQLLSDGLRTNEVIVNAKNPNRSAD